MPSGRGSRAAIDTQLGFRKRSPLKPKWCPIVYICVRENYTSYYERRVNYYENLCKSNHGRRCI